MAFSDETDFTDCWRLYDAGATRRVAEHTVPLEKDPVGRGECWRTDFEAVGILSSSLVRGMEPFRGVELLAPQAGRWETGTGDRDLICRGFVAGVLPCAGEDGSRWIARPTTVGASRVGMCTAGRLTIKDIEV